MNENYKIYFMLVKKYNLLEEKIRLWIATECYFYQQSHLININDIYFIADRKIKGSDVIALVNIVKDLDKLNDFCTSYYATDCKFKITNREEVAKKIREILTLSTFDLKQIKKQISLVELEEYREYFATPKEKMAYDALRRTSDYTYRRCDLLIGKMFYDELRDDSDKSLLRKFRETTNIYGKDLLTFAFNYCQIYHPDDLKRTKLILGRMKHGFNYEKMGLVKDYIKGLENLLDAPMNYDERFCIKYNLNERQLKNLLASLKFVEKEEDKYLMEKVLFLQQAHKMEVLKRIKDLLPKLQQQLEEGIYVESEQRYRKMNVVDYLTYVTLSADKFRDCLIELEVDKAKREKWVQFLEENVGKVNRLAALRATTWEYYVANPNSIDIKTAKTFSLPKMEETFFHMPTLEERLIVYNELKKIFLQVSIQMFYRILEVEYGYPKWIEQKEREKRKIK